MADTTKQFERERPLHRIQSPTQEPGRDRADGRGFNCGCHSPDQGPGIGEGVIDFLAGELMRTIPGWVPVERALGDKLHELEGTLVRSFQTWTDVPFFQFHAWYDWNFHVKPDLGYDYARGLGNDEPPEDFPPGEPHGTVLREGERLVVPAGAMECEWDTGGFGRPNGPMFNTPMLWPISGSHVWIAGRWIYDCGHSSSNQFNDVVRSHDSGFAEVPVFGELARTTTTGTIVQESATEIVVRRRDGSLARIPRSQVRSIRRAGLMRTELHPCKAMATAWREAEKFDENDFHVPATKFLFFTSRLGGYRRFRSIKDGDAARRDFEFIVDLPPIEAADPLRWAIGHTEQFPQNTGVIREPLLLAKFDFSPFTGVQGTVGQIDPIVALVDPPAGGAAMPNQARIRIPVTQLPGDPDAYGVIVSLGWFDPSHVQARRVKVCRVDVTEFKREGRSTDAPQLCNLKVCINNRWFFRELGAVTFGQPISLGALAATLFLDEDDAILISAHGAATAGLHRFIRFPARRRTVRIRDQRDAVWDTDIDTDDLEACHATLDGITDRVIDELGLGQASSVREESDPLGIVDPDSGPDSERGHNPLKVKDLEGENMQFQLTGFRTRADARSAELVENRRQVDYRLKFKVSVHRQSVGGT